jgi:hypothetical protein
VRPVQRRSSRPSSITLALALLALGSLIGGTWIVMRAQRARSAASSSAREQVEAPANEVPVAPHAQALEPPAPLPPTVPPRAAPVAVSPSEPHAAAAAADDQPAASSAPPGRARPGALISNHNRRLEEADEQVFATGQLPESTRAAIRRINLAYRTQTETEVRGGSSADQESGAEVVTASAARSRQDALRLLLGDQPAREFDAQERGAVRRLRGKYRFEWGRQLHE